MLRSALEGVWQPLCQPTTSDPEALLYLVPAAHTCYTGATSSALPEMAFTEDSLRPVLSFAHSSVRRLRTSLR